MLTGKTEMGTTALEGSHSCFVLVLLPPWNIAGHWNTDVWSFAYRAIKLKRGRAPMSHAMQSVQEAKV